MKILLRGILVFSFGIFGFFTSVHSSEKTSDDSTKNETEISSDDNEREPAWIKEWNPEKEYNLNTMMNGFYKRQESELKKVN